LNSQQGWTIQSSPIWPLNFFAVIFTANRIVQLKLGIQQAAPATVKNSAAQYKIFALCNKCGGTHDMAVSVILEDGPIEKQEMYCPEAVAEIEEAIRLSRTLH
jgi:hypothetical protein